MDPQALRVKLLGAVGAGDLARLHNLAVLVLQRGVPAGPASPSTHCVSSVGLVPACRDSQVICRSGHACAQQRSLQLSSAADAQPGGLHGRRRWLAKRLPCSAALQGREAEHGAAWRPASRIVRGEDDVRVGQPLQLPGPLVAVVDHDLLRGAALTHWTHMWGRQAEAVTGSSLPRRVLCTTGTFWQHCSPGCCVQAQVMAQLCSALAVAHQPALEWHAPQERDPGL